MATAAAHAPSAVRTRGAVERAHRHFPATCARPYNNSCVATAENTTEIVAAIITVAASTVEVVDGVLSVRLNAT